VAVGVAVGVNVGVEVATALVKVIVSAGRFPALVASFVSKRFAVVDCASLPSTIQPKLPAGLFSHDCASATIWAELHV
jgi:hypothetical protein